MATPPWTPDASSHQAPAGQRRATSGCLIAGVVTAIVVVLICTVVAAVVLVQRLRDEAATGAGPGNEPAAAASAGSPAGGACRWLPTDEASNPNIKNVGTPPTTVPTSGVQQLTMTTDHGVIKVQVETAKAPCAAASITYLAGRKFFDNTRCHRLVTEGIEVLQCGDPTATGMGGPSYRYAEENLPNVTDPAKNYPVGTLAMAKTQDPATTGSQFFIVYGPSPLTPDYTVLGTLTAGLDVVQAIGKAGAVDPAGKAATDGAPSSPVTITSLTVTPA
ncbi:peptidylprolyl isomerase [Catellatospora sichuanensis]|uniref:peptidylprolyl isomerase n=1 Tax=Catellatospora sichuanensis TaxID=1969805 RepID=UPI001FEA59CF|nr:peptidylprolyl isomerase [Catellatospora sichuanensis]